MTKSVIPTNAEILDMLSKGSKDGENISQEVYKFIPCSLLVNEIEKIKRRGGKLPSDIISGIDMLLKIPAYTIDLSPSALYNAIEDEDFANQFLNSKGNPFRFSTVASIYGDECWGDQLELLESSKELRWT